MLLHHPVWTSNLVWTLATGERTWCLRPLYQEGWKVRALGFHCFNSAEFWYRYIYCVHMTMPSCACNPITLCFSYTSWHNSILLVISPGFKPRKPQTNNPPPPSTSQPSNGKEERSANHPAPEDVSEAKAPGLSLLAHYADDSDSDNDGWLVYGIAHRPKILIHFTMLVLWAVE